MSTPDLEKKERNRAIARNEEKRKAIGAFRVSAWAIFVAAVLCTIVFGIVWAWIRR